MDHETQNSYIMRHKKNNSKFPYYRYPKEIFATFSLISCQIDYTRVSDQCINIQQNPTSKMSQKVQDIDLKQPLPNSGVESMREGAVPPKTELNTVRTGSPNKL